MSTKFTQEDVNVQVSVQLGVVVTLGLYQGPITRKVIAENVAAMFATQDTVIEDSITKVEILGVSLDDGTELIELSVPGFPA